MTRIKLLAISTTAADSVSVTTDVAAADPRPAKRDGGGSGKALKK